MKDVPEMTPEEESGLSDSNGAEDLAVSGVGAKIMRSRKL
jgi:hypothetical protein